MTDKIAEVALALAHKRMPFTVAYSNLSATDTEMLREEAKAAIEAMREPTDEMIAAAAGPLPMEVVSDHRNPETGLGPYTISVGHPAPVWRAMIDKALEGK